MHLTCAVPPLSLPYPAYIVTGICVITTGLDGLDLTIITFVGDPRSLESSCPVRMSLRLADGDINVVVNGEEAFLAPCDVVLVPEAVITAINYPGECRSSWFKEYWESKKFEFTS